MKHSEGRLKGSLVDAGISDFGAVVERVLPAPDPSTATGLALELTAAEA
jgi:hypothetical protein